MTNISRLIAARERLGMNQEQSSNYFGISRQWLSLLEIGRHKIPMAMHPKIEALEALPLPSERADIQALVAGLSLEDRIILMGELRKSGVRYTFLHKAKPRKAKPHKHKLHKYTPRNGEQPVEMLPLDSLRFKALRKSKGMTKDEVALRIGMSIHTVAKWDNGSNPVPARWWPVLESIANQELNNTMDMWTGGQIMDRWPDNACPFIDHALLDPDIGGNTAPENNITLPIDTNKQLL